MARSSSGRPSDDVAGAYDKAATALLLIDPYNDFISPGGKVWDRLRGVIESNDCVAHMQQVLDVARGAGRAGTAATGRK